jgi:predicted transcriptional regulator of viral defense system
MKIKDLNKIKKLYFSARDIADAFDITYDSAKVTCSRYTNNGLIVRVKRNFYVLHSKWLNMPEKERFSVANILQVPSYISLTTALGYYEITTQLQRGFIESVSVKKTKRFDIEGKVFNFSKIKSQYFNNFIRRDNVFIAIPEKALVDAVYLTAFNMYRLDFDSLDYEKLNFKKIEGILKQYPERVKRLWSKICKT